jgi:outer membrane protein assembly factor BamB
MDQIHPANLHEYTMKTIALANAAREDGVVMVADIRTKFTQLAENDMQERIIASPVPIESRLLIRGEKHLFCVGE